MSATPSPANPAPLAPRKTSPVVWILLGIAGFLLLAGVVMVAGGYFLLKKVADNPVAAAAAVLAAANSDVEIVSRDDEHGTVTFRDRRSGKTATMNLDQIKQGRISFSGDGREVAFGKGVELRLPNWIPEYSDATVQGSFSAAGGDEAAAVGFTTKDSADKVLKFYEDKFRRAGFTITNQVLQRDGGAGGGSITAVLPDEQKRVTVSVSGSEDETTVGITYSTKK